MNKPKIINHLISIGFTEVIGKWRPVWGQGDGEYWHGQLEKDGNIVFTDRDTTLYKYTWNGVVMPEEFFMNLTSESVGDKSNKVISSIMQVTDKERLLEAFIRSEYEDEMVIQLKIKRAKKFLASNGA